MPGILRLHPGGGVSHSHGPSSGSGSGTKQKKDPRAAYIASTSGGTGAQGSNPAVSQGGNQTNQGTPRDKAIAAASAGTTTTDLQQSIGSLDRRIQKALEAGNTDLAKDLRKRQKQFVNQLGLQAAQDVMLSQAPLSMKDQIRKRIKANPNLLTTPGMNAYQGIMNLDFINPTIDLQNKFPKQYKKMYPLEAYLQGGGPTISGIKSLFGMDDKPISFIGGDDVLLPRDAYPLNTTTETASNIANELTPEQTELLSITQDDNKNLSTLIQEDNTPSTVYNPETADAQNFDYMAQALRDFDLYKKNLPKNQIAEQVETETEDTVPGTINLTKQDDVVLSGDPNETIEEDSIIDPKVNYEQEFMDTYGPDSDPFQAAVDRGSSLGTQGYEGLTYDEIPMMDKQYLRGQIRPYTDMETSMYSGDDPMGGMPAFYRDRFGDFQSFQDVPFSSLTSQISPISDMRKLGQEIQTFPGLDPLQNAKGGIATLENGGEAGGGKLTAPSMRDLMSAANLMGINPATLSTKDAILPMLSESGEFEPDFLSMNQLIFNLAKARKPNERITTNDIQQATQDISGPNLSNRDDSGYARMSTFEKLKMMADSDG